MQRSVDVIVVGAGPAGLTAATYLARARMSVVVFKDHEGSNLLRVPLIANLFGFPKGVSGRDLIAAGEQQATKYGADIRVEEVLGCREVTMLSKNDADRRTLPDARFVIRTEHAVYGAQCVVVAAGIQLRSAGIEKEFSFVGRGVAYCVACDGPFFKGKKVLVIGAGNLAASEALDLHVHTRDVTVNTNGAPLTMSRVWQDKLARAGVAIEDDRLVRAHGSKWLEEIELADGSRRPVEGLFLAMGTASAIDFAKSLGLAMRGQSLKVDRHGRTNLKGVWAAGDVTGPPRQIGKSVGDAVRAAIDIIETQRGGTYVDHQEA